MSIISQVITTLPDAPNRSTDTPETYVPKADAMMSALPMLIIEENTWAGQANTVASEVNIDKLSAATSATNAATSATNAATSATNAATSATSAATSASDSAASAASAVSAPSTSATSTTSLLVGTGSKSLTIQTGKSLVVGMSVKISYTTTPTIWMHGDITAYNTETGALTVNITQMNGSGTQSLWTVSLSAPAGPAGQAGSTGSDLFNIFIGTI